MKAPRVTARPVQGATCAYFIHGLGACCQEPQSSRAENAESASCLRLSIPGGAFALFPSLRRFLGSYRQKRDPPA